MIGDVAYTFGSGCLCALIIAVLAFVLVKGVKRGSR